jgi:hypothetical protein
MNEKPTMMVASGTSEAIVFDRLKIKRQINMMNISAVQINTASSFATMEPRSCYTFLECCCGKRLCWVSSPSNSPSKLFAPDKFFELLHASRVSIGLHSHPYQI